jgi:nitrogen fixation protein FixH
MELATVDKPRLMPAWKSPWVIFWIALVIAVLGVNGVMVYLAIATNPGLVVQDYYERGQHYERTLLSKKAHDPGWVLRTDLPKDIRAGKPTDIRLQLVDNAGRPVTPDRVRLFVYRPADAARDFSVPMTEVGLGRYAAEVSFPLVGVWDTLAAARNGEDEYQVGQRVEVGRP